MVGAAANQLIGERCHAQNMGFMRCKQTAAGAGDPRACLARGRDVTGCVADTLAAVRKHAGGEFGAFRDCLEEHGGDFSACRAQQRAFRETWAAAGASA